MKKIKILLSFFILFLNPILTGLSSEDHIREVKRLEEGGLYQSAWTYLHAYAEEIDFSYNMIIKTELCTRFYARTDLHRMFAFVDLKPGETLEEVRRKPRGTESMKLFDPAGGLLSALEQDPENGEISFWLGEYYFSLLHLFGKESGLTQEDLYSRITSSYHAAIEHGVDKETLYAHLAFTELSAKDWSSSISHFRMALEKNPENPGYHYNLAVALMNIQQLDDADKEVRSALRLYPRGSYAADTLFLGSTIALMREDEEDTLEYLNTGKKTAPLDYRFPERLIPVHLVRNDKKEALENCRVLFDLYPHNPENCQTIMHHFNAFNALEDLTPFFEDQIVRYEEDPEALGNLIYHEGVLFLLTGKKEDARRKLEKAQEIFHEIYPEDHQIFGIIANLLSQSG